VTKTVEDVLLKNLLITHVYQKMNASTAKQAMHVKLLFVKKISTPLYLANVLSTNVTMEKNAPKILATLKLENA